MFMFLNENDLLEVRLNEHWDFVEKFIIVEAGQTHVGNKKSKNFDTDRFRKYSDKIEYRFYESLDDLCKLHPEYLDYRIPNLKGHKEPAVHWERENIQTNIGMLTLEELNLKDDDLVLWAGLDEILRKEIYAMVYDQLFLYEPNARVTFEVDTYAYKLNLFHKKLNAPTIAPYHSYKSFPPATQRQIGMATHEVNDAGWQFTGLSKTPENLLYKYRNFAHAFQHANVADEDMEKAVMDDMYKVKRVEINEQTHPSWLVKNLDMYEEYIF